MINKFVYCYRNEETRPNHSFNGEEITGSARQVLELERETLQLRRELQEARAKKEESDQKLFQ